MPVVTITDGIRRTRRRVHRVKETDTSVTLYGIYGTSDSKLLRDHYPPGKRTENWHGVSQSLADPRADRSEDFPQIFIPTDSPLEVEVED